MSGTPVRHDMPPPQLGQHTEQVLAEVLGLPSEQIEALRQQDII
jgi:crotonobetainyl-CoA:carnitine CoA-transferase CaiB-like acyl-CoA transferase